METIFFTGTMYRSSTAAVNIMQDSSLHTESLHSVALLEKGGFLNCTTENQVVFQTNFVFPGELFTEPAR